MIFFFRIEISFLFSASFWNFSIAINKRLNTCGEVV